jgi:hypothetical protein
MYLGDPADPFFFAQATKTTLGDGPVKFSKNYREAGNSVIFTSTGTTTPLANPFSVTR